MDPIDFTKPEAFGQSGARAPGEVHGASEIGQPNPEAAQRLRGAMGSALRWSIYALIVWAIGAALLATALEQAKPGALPLQWPPDAQRLLASMQEPAVLAQMIELAWMTLDLVFVPVLVFAVFIWLPMPLMALNKRRNAADGARPVAGLGDFELPLLIARALTFTAIAFTVIAAGCIARAAWAVVEGDDPMEILPGVTPPYLGEFLARHPALSADSDSSIGYVILHDGKGHAMRLHRAELEGAQARFEPCPQNLDAALSGGIPPYPLSDCVTLLRLRKTKAEQVHYRFEALDDPAGASIAAHFAKWVEQHAAGSASANRKGGTYEMSAGSRDGAWHLEVNSSNGGATTIVIRHTLSLTR